MNIMNFLAVLALVPAVRGQMQRSIAGQLVDAIEDFKQRMPCGFPEYGLPPLAPYEAEHLKISTDSDGLQASGEVTDVRLYGLNDFDIVSLRVQAFLSRVIFKFNWNNVYLKTNYNVTVAPGYFGLTRYGPAKFALKNFTVWGVIKYHLRLLSGKLSLKELSVYVSLADVKSEIDDLSNIKIVNKKLNRMIEEWFMLAVNENTNNVALFTNYAVLPVVNNFLSNKTISDLLAKAGNGEEKEPCIPPEQEQEIL